MKDLIVLFEKHKVGFSTDLYQQVIETIMLGESARSILENEISQDELEEIDREFTEVSARFFLFLIFPFECTYL